jgi:AbrB family looped-hinge helix DNA binding protein
VSSTGSVTERSFYQYIVEMPLLSRTKLGRDLRTTVPREVRKILDIKEGDIVEWVFEDGKIIVRRGGGNG